MANAATPTLERLAAVMPTLKEDQLCFMDGAASAMRWQNATKAGEGPSFREVLDAETGKLEAAGEGRRQ